MNEDRQLRPLELLEKIDSCRQGDRDLHDPAFVDLAARLDCDPRAKSLYDRALQWDAALTEALDDVPVPAGLEARILAKLAAAEAASLSPQAVAAVTTTTGVAGDRSTSRERPASSGRRRWMWVSAATAACAAVTAIGVNEWLHRQPPLSGESLAEEAAAFFRSEDLAVVDGKVNIVQADKTHPFSRSVVRTPGISARRIAAFLGRPGLGGIAYDLSAGGTQATLYVVKTPGNLTLPGAPPARPSTTGGCAAGAWQANGFLYVLVVQGNDQAYQGFLNRGSLA